MILYTVWLQKQNFTDEQYYEIFNTKVDVGEAIGITIQHPLLSSFLYKTRHNIYIFALIPDEIGNYEKNPRKGPSHKFYFRKVERNKKIVGRLTNSLYYRC